MSKKTETTKPTSKSAKPTADASANDKARADALAKLNAKPTTDASKRPTKAARGTKPEGWQNDPLESDAALKAALAKKEAPTTIAHDAKSAKGGGKNAKAAKGLPTAERGAKGGKAPKTKPAKAKRLSALDAAAKVLAESDRPLRAIDMIETMHAKGWWSSPGGRTPAATLYAAVIREISGKGKDARFKKVDRGMFTSTPTSKTGKGA